MDALQITRSESARFTPDPRRVIIRPFLPREEVYPDGTSRMQLVLERILAMPEHDVATAFQTAFRSFDGRHRDLDETVERNVDIVIDRLGHLALDVDEVSRERRMLIGAYFTHEYSIEAAALGNPSMVAAPDQSGLEPGAVRFIVSLRAIGEGHISSIEFRSGVVDTAMRVTLDAPSRYASTGRTSRSAAADYRVTFTESIDISERVLFPSGPTESHGMEDARFVRFVDDSVDDDDQRDHPDRVTYYATYTAFDGHRIRPQLIETADFRSFEIAPMSGPAAQNKGIALFPRKIDGEFVALGRHDNVNNYVMTSTDMRVWTEAEVIQEPERPWELMQLGNCGSPLETDAGWLVITHGVGPFREYRLGAVLLDLDDPSHVIGHLKQPLLTADAAEREGYVPNVVYSCGSMIHAGHLVVPYGYADVGAGIATVPLDTLLDRLTDSPTRR